VEGAPNPPAAKKGASSMSTLDDPMLSALALVFLANVLPEADVTRGCGFRGVVPVVLVQLDDAPLDLLRDRAIPSLFNISLNILSERDVSRRCGVGAASWDDGSIVVMSFEVRAKMGLFVL